MIEVPFTLLPHADGLPRYASDGAAGLDLAAALPDDAPVTIPPLGRAMIPTGLTMALPAGYEAQVRPRSGLAAKHGVTVLNAPGTIDCDYRGEVKVVLVNLSDIPFTVARGERIAQMVVAPVTRVAPVAVASLDETTRGAGGFGSTGR
ncbi:dUTP diphosphatase [Acuticoccus mangrovi]|uniref:Deoxyuridine 5'-triphosphate nucleotidohydrolase n=1 Tax=Acuticoccus mangrovi TaxID=2796142 RepID=A0A934IRJ6_9HYPH|nr:dUTP diphosphatase [Acuticoccus mangrovi]MBJ3776947.1 dUTP diphosphatase [Acuticoccus mangrovi]